MEQIYQTLISRIPDSIDFGFITVKYLSTKTIYFTNPGNTSILFNIENTHGYKFTPPQGIIPKNKKIEVKINIIPEDATVLVSNAKITLDHKYSKVIKISSIAKYPYLQINQTAIDFGKIEIGKTIESSLIITNSENVPAKFKIEKESIQPGKHPNIFIIKNTSGEIPPNSSYLLKLTFKPYFPSVTFHDIFKIITIEGNHLNFSCHGSCLSHNTWLSAKRVNFKSIPLGTEMTQLIRIYNDGSEATEYQIFHDNSGVFIINNLQGIIPPESNLRIKITFRPYETILYYERVYCLINNHFLLFIDIFGSCSEVLTKAPLLEQKHIDIFRMKMLKGIFFSYNKKNEDGELVERLLKTKEMKTISDKGSNTEETLIDFTSQVQLHKEMFWESTSNNRLFSFNTDHIDFNFVECGKVSEPFLLRVTNNSNANIRVKWIYDKPINTSNWIKVNNIFNLENTVFFAIPEEKLIPQKASAEFKMYFKPNKREFYFYSDLPCMGTIEEQTLRVDQSSRNILKGINKQKLSEVGRELIAQSSNEKNNKNINIKGSVEFKSHLMRSMSMSKRNSILKKEKPFNYFEPPISLKISMVGHSFPPGRQIFLPIYEIYPKKEIFFPSASINQSLYQTLKINNTSDTPLFYKFSSDPLGIFKVHRKYGLIPSNNFHLICLEFCPKDTYVYKFPLRIIFNHNKANMKTVMLHGLCSAPIIKIEGVRNEIYFPPGYIGMKTKKTIEVKNLSPIKICVNITVEKNENALIEVFPNYFELDVNFVKKIDVIMCPMKNSEIISLMKITAEGVYDSQSESVGIYNPSSLTLLKLQSVDFEKNRYVKEVTLLGRGTDGKILLEPKELQFGTVKVGFHKKMTFSIENPTITNFYFKLVPQPIEPNNEIEKEINEMISIDYNEGLINSFCKKDINITFQPKTRMNLIFKIKVIASDHNPQQHKNKNSFDKNQIEDFHHEEVKCDLIIKAKGDYPLIKIVDIRSSIVSSSYLWRQFNVNEANAELEKKLSDDEINYISDVKSNKKIQEIRDQLKCIKLNFGRHILKPSKTPSTFEVYMTLKNEGGVASEFYFKFPEDIEIKREIWMHPVEPTSNQKVEYHVLKESIFSLEPKKSKLEPNECCNICFKYTLKEIGEHRLRVIFQIIHGKPLVFELKGECISEKVINLEIPKRILSFSYVPIGYMKYIAAPFELRNQGAMRIKYNIEQESIDNYNKSHGSEIFKIEDIKGMINQGDSKYLIVYFRPLADIFYRMELVLNITDERELYHEIITIEGNGYHPLKFTSPIEISPFNNIPKSLLCNSFKGNAIKNCGFNIEEIDFGQLKDTAKSHTLILYNYSKENSLYFDFIEPGFIMTDNLIIQPNRITITPNSHILIKLVLFPGKQPCQYEGDIQVRISWNMTKIQNEYTPMPNTNTVTLSAQLKPNITMNTSKIIAKENLFIRIIRKSIINEKCALTPSKSNYNSSFIETMLFDYTKEILSDEMFQKIFLDNIDSQPLGLFQWTNDVKYTSHMETRNKIIKENMIKASKLSKDNNIGLINRPSIMVGTRFRKKVTMIGMASDESKNDHFNTEVLGGKEDNELQEKYMKEMLSKYKIPLSTYNENTIIVNKHTRKLISEIIMENTILNIISEAVYGKTDLTQKPRIYFFLKK